MAEPVVTGKLRVSATGKLQTVAGRSLVTDDDPDQACCLTCDPDCDEPDQDWGSSNDWAVTVTGAFRKLCPSRAVFLATVTGNITVRITLINPTLVCNLYLYARVNDAPVAFANGGNPRVADRFVGPPFNGGVGSFEETTVAVTAGDTLVLHADYCSVGDPREPLGGSSVAGCGRGCWGPWISENLHVDVITHVHGLTGIYTNGTLYDGTVPAYDSTRPGIDADDRCEWASGYKTDLGLIAGNVPATLVDAHDCAVSDWIYQNSFVLGYQYILERSVYDGTSQTLVWRGTLTNQMCDPRGVYTRTHGADTTTATVTVS